MNVMKATDRFQRRHRTVAYVLAVAYKYVDDQGGFLAALITYYGFLSLFPALLLLTTVSGYLLAGDVAAQQRLLDSALGNFPVIGTALRNNLGTLHGSPVGILVGVLGLLYGVLGVGQAIQQAFNTAWAVPRNARPDPIRSRLKSLALALLTGVVLAVSTGLTGVGSATGPLNAHLAGAGRALLLIGALATNVVVFVVAFRLLTSRKVTIRDLLPGAVAGALAWQALQALGTTYVSRVLSRSTNIYGAFGIVLGLLAWIYLAAVIVVVAAEMNVVYACRLWPRSLLAPFSDGLPLTPADEKAYVSYAEMARHKSSERIDVSFDELRSK